MEISKVRVRFRFNDLKFKRFKFGSGSPKESGFYRLAVQVLVRLLGCNLFFDLAFVSSFSSVLCLCYFGREKFYYEFFTTVM